MRAVINVLKIMMVFVMAGGGVSCDQYAKDNDGVCYCRRWCEL